LDTEVLQSWQMLSQGSDDDFLDEVIGLFLNGSPSIIEEMKRECAAGNLTALRKLGHKLRGSGANLGAVALAQLCLDLEARAAAESDASLLMPLVEQIEQEFSVVRTCFETQYLNKRL
jgi:HPt (histidine-containing phosphotransfer) domain-containing protein